MKKCGDGTAQAAEIRDRILDACVDHALAHGLPDRLEPFAAASGTSTRMLIYHFSTRDTLLRETLRRARRRQRDLFGELVSPRPDEPYVSTLRRAWHVMTGADGRPYLTMFGKLRDSAEQQLWPGFRREATTDWLQLFEDGMRSIGRPELGTLVLAVIRGLIMDVEATGEVSRANRAFDDFLTTLAAVTTQGNHAIPAGSAADMPEGRVIELLASDMALKWRLGYRRAPLTNINCGGLITERIRWIQGRRRGCD